MTWIALACTTFVVAATGAAYAGASDRIDGRVIASPLSVVVDVPDGPRRRGADFRVVAVVANGGSTRLEDVTVTLVRSSALRLDRPAAQALPRIPPLQSRRTAWWACSNTPGAYLVLARARLGQLTAESTGEIVRILPSNHTC